MCQNRRERSSSRYACPARLISRGWYHRSRLIAFNSLELDRSKKRMCMMRDYANRAIQRSGDRTDAFNTLGSNVGVISERQLAWISFLAIDTRSVLETLLAIPAIGRRDRSDGNQLKRIIAVHERHDRWKDFTCVARSLRTLSFPRKLTAIRDHRYSARERRKHAA